MSVMRNLSIGEVARAAEVNVQTLRYYERRGLLETPERTGAGRRRYAEETIRLIRFIKRAQELGFTLAEIKELIGLRQSRGRDRSKVRRLAADKLGNVEEKIRRLSAIRRAIMKLVESCDCQEGAIECPILEALDDPHQRRQA